MSCFGLDILRVVFIAKYMVRYILETKMQNQMVLFWHDTH
jgi:hypothetical protein